MSHTSCFMLHFEYKDMAYLLFKEHRISPQTLDSLSKPNEYNYTDWTNNCLDCKPHLGKTSILMNFLQNPNKFAQFSVFFFHEGLGTYWANKPTVNKESSANSLTILQRSLIQKGLPVNENNYLSLKFPIIAKHFKQITLIKTAQNQ